MKTTKQYNAILRLYKLSLSCQPTEKHIRLLENLLSEEIFPKAKTPSSRSEMFRYFKYQRKSFNAEWIPIVAMLCRCEEIDVLNELKK